MNEITYRTLTKQDRPVIESLISDSFHLDQYVPEPRVLAQLSMPICKAVWQSRHLPA